MCKMKDLIKRWPDMTKRIISHYGTQVDETMLGLGLDMIHVVSHYLYWQSDSTISVECLNRLGLTLT